MRILQSTMSAVLTAAIFAVTANAFTAMPSKRSTGNWQLHETKIDKDIANIFQQNLDWRAKWLEEDPEFFDKLGSVHEPKYMWIGCADARVPANEIMGEAAGSVFVCRNVANMVVNTDVSLMAALQFAVTVLKVEHIIVCGHYECGGIKASLERKDHRSPLENWLRGIKDIYRLHRKELDAIADPDARHRRLVELNVVEQCLNLFKTSAIQRQRIQNYQSAIEKVKKGETDERPYTTPRIHACVFDPKIGILQKLEVDFKELIDDLHEIYDLYTLDDEDIMDSDPRGAPSDIKMQVKEDLKIISGTFKSKPSKRLQKKKLAKETK